MLEKIDLSKKMEKEEYKRRGEALALKLGKLQRECKALKIPVMIVVEGLSAAGKGTLINELIEPLDPRGFTVYAIKEETEEEHMRPFLWRFWNITPEKGRIAILDSSWYRRVSEEYFDGYTTDKQLGEAYDEIKNFERQLTDDGMVIIKLFNFISKDEQKKRMRKLLDSKETAWRVTDGDLKRNKNYKDYVEICEEMLRRTDSAYAPWEVVEATDRRFAVIKVLTIVADALERQVEKYKTKKEPVIDSQLEKDQVISSSSLKKADLTKALTREEYTARKKELQDRLSMLHNVLYRKRIPVVLGFEGWDAGGKGGAIKRLTQALDPRGYAVHPTASPNDIEKAHHYLWRFWTNMPKAGHVAIFDRTWYGRVMVERIEGFCSTEEWSRAYTEINDMERHLANSGAIVLKFWMQIDRDEQEKRFRERQANPDKNWKITEEDWRNREKWDAYEIAVDEMLIRTSTTYAPWIIVEGNNKYYARIKVLETVVDAIETYLKKRGDD